MAPSHSPFAQLFVSWAQEGRTLLVSHSSLSLAFCCLRTSVPSWRDQSGRGILLSSAVWYCAICLRFIASKGCAQSHGRTVTSPGAVPKHECRAVDKLVGWKGQRKGLWESCSKSRLFIGQEMKWRKGRVVKRLRNRGREDMSGGWGNGMCPCLFVKLGWCVNDLKS